MADCRWLIFVVLILIGFVSAEEYYVSNSGNDSWNGLSDATAWKTIEKINGFKFSVGDDVYFKCGDEWKPSTHFSVKWSGNETNQAIIGAYYVENGLIKTDGCGSFERPIIEGLMKNGPGDTLEMAGGVPDSNSAAMIDVVYEYGKTNIYKRNITVQDFHILNSNGVGVKLFGVDYGNIKRVKVENCMSSGIIMKLANINYSRKEVIPTYDENNIGGSTKSIIEDCEVTEDNLGPRKFYTNNGAGIVAVQSRNVLIRRNYVHEGYGEAIGVYNNNGIYDHIGYSTVEDNVVFDMYNANIYFSNTNHNIARRNLVYSTGNPRFATLKTGDDRAWGGSGIGIANEEGDSSQEARQSDYNYVYNNMVANTGACFGIGTQWDDESDIISNVKFFNNICVGNRNGFGIGPTGFINRGNNNEIKNNIFLMTEDSEYQFRGYAPSKGISIDYNLYSSNPNQTSGKYICGLAWHCERISGPNDPTYATPILKKTSGWNDIENGSLRFDDFLIEKGSPSINKGADLSNYFDIDYYGVKRPQEGKWDIGAFEYGGTVSPPISENCNNNIDDDSDGLIDCKDSNCPVCVEEPKENYNGTCDGAKLIYHFNNGDATGKFGNGYDSNGVSNFIKENLDLSNSDDVSISFWYKPESIGSTQILFELSNNYNFFRDGFVVFLRNDGVVEFASIGNIGGSVWRSETRLVPGNWYHIVGIFDKKLTSGEVRGYINGTLNGNLAVNNDNAGKFGNYSFYIGARNGSSYFANGVIDEIVVWDRVLNYSEISDLELSSVNCDKVSGVSLSDIFAKISEWKAGRVSLVDVFSLIRGWGRL
jgi:hypothetical protein